MGRQRVPLLMTLRAATAYVPKATGRTSSAASVVTTLDNITEAALLHTVRTRYARDDIYTNVLRILIAVNPLKSMSFDEDQYIGMFYEDQYIGMYKEAPDPAALPPHILGIGADVFERLTSEDPSQAVLSSGESGAGKTESTKLMLLYISQAFSTGGASQGFEDNLLEINLMLEAFGNAKTNRNNNSSCFGKWMEILCNPVQMSLCGASVTDHLLEVTRVIGQGPEERNNHFFYQLAQDESFCAALARPSGGVTQPGRFACAL